ncbi:MAG: hypothetical protein KA745_11655 [Gemmatimonadales bacterium]|jgi:hypothetical protein|nr:hypothetical protein [Gemmatimonadales bacterium]
MTKARTRTLKLPYDLTPAQALAVFEIIDQIRDRLWLLYADDIQSAMRDDQQRVDPRQLSIPLDDDIDPF